MARLLTCNIGNTTLALGLFVDGRLRRRWAMATAAPAGWRLGGVSVDRAVLCSVVPGQTRRVAARLRRALDVRPEQLTSRSAHGLRIGYRDPSRLGADRLAAALGARERFPKRDIIIVDCGTATTLTALRRDGRILGGAILPGLSLWSAALARHTAQLPRVSPRRPKTVLGRSPEDAIAAGAWFGHLAAVHGVLARLKSEAFGRRPALILATGGNAHAMAGEDLFDEVDRDLVLRGLCAFALG